MVNSPDIKLALGVEFLIGPPSLIIFYCGVLPSQLSIHFHGEYRRAKLMGRFSFYHVCDQYGSCMTEKRKEGCALPCTVPTGLLMVSHETNWNKMKITKKDTHAHTNMPSSFPHALFLFDTKVSRQVTYIPSVAVPTWPKQSPWQYKISQTRRPKKQSDIWLLHCVYKTTTYA